jgi:hypothetical protein
LFYIFFSLTLFKPFIAFFFYYCFWAIENFVYFL